MNPRLQHLFDTLETDRLQLSEKLLKLTPEESNRAKPGKWSIRQIIAHLITAERMSLQYMRKKILGMKAIKNSGLTTEVMMVMLKLSQRLPFKFKAPLLLVESTDTSNSLDQLLAEWGREREALRKFLENFTDDQLRKNIYKHFIAGRLNIQHALIFQREHFLHHLPQIKKLLK